MRIAWISHQFASADNAPKRPGLLPGRFAGGAEMSTEEMIAQAPSGVEVVRVRLPGSLPSLDDFDRIVIGATEHLTAEMSSQIAPYLPIYWVRSPQHQWRETFFSEARMLIWPSHECAKWHSWSQTPYEVCPAPLDPTSIPRGRQKQDHALWAGRDIAHKGRAEARKYAREQGWKLVEITDSPREQVLEAMSEARWFVHLPQNIVDPCPRAVIEAEIAGCEIITNELCGRVPVRGADAVAEYVAGSAERFWGWTLNN
jgi:hypothetical protein